MKTEDIDKKIGMPDVDAEWARFEQEVIGKEPKANKRSIYSWIGGLGIAACLLLFFLINMGDEPKPATPVVAEQAEPKPVQQPAAKENKEEPIVHIVNTPRFKNALRKELALAEPKPATPVVAEEVEPEPAQQPAEEEVKEEPIVNVVSTPQPKKEPVLANNDTPASKGLETSAHEYTGKVQKFNMDDVKDLAFESVDQSLKNQIAGLDVVPNSSHLGKGVTMRLRGIKPIKESNQPLVLINGERLPKSIKHALKKASSFDTEEDYENALNPYLKKHHQAIDQIVVYKDDESSFKQKYGDLAKNGVINITTKPSKKQKLTGQIAGLPDSPPNDSILYIVNGVPQPKENNKWLDNRSYLNFFKGQHLLVDSINRNINEEAKQRYLERFGMAAKYGGVEYFCMEDTLSDNYMNQHEELKASRRRISGIVLDENGRPLDCATIHIMQFQPEKKIWGVKTTDSKGKFAFWIPREGIKLHFETFFHKTVKVEPTDKPLTIRMRLSKDGKKLKKLYFE